MILNKILSKIKVMLFHLLYNKKFKKLGTGSYFMEKLRLDGSRYIEIGNRVSVQKFSWLIALQIDETEPRMIIGDGCILGNFNHIAAVHRVVLGKNVLTADRVYISDNLHVYEDINTPIMHQGAAFKGAVEIGEGSWIGENVAIIGANIGKNCIIGANCVVTKDIPDYSVAVGNPAKVVKKFNQDTNQWEKVI
ncbi:MAG: DapH/DapD/GlmU-related protein [Negativicutes bacterium]